MNIPRYRPAVTNVSATAYCGAHPEGEYVLATDYAALSAERDAARADARRLREALRRYGKHEWKCVREIARRETPKFSDEAREDQSRRAASCDCGLGEALRAADPALSSSEPVTNEEPS